MSDRPAFEVSPSSPGTDEGSWLEAIEARDLPVLDEDQPRRLVVAAPHPDDEVLGIGGLVRRLVARRVPVEVVAVTDGERGLGTRDGRGSRRLAQRRSQETLRALQRLGASASVVRLAVPDGEVDRHVGGVTESIERRLGPGDWCAATWRGDGHPDHEATGAAAAAACRATGARLIEFPIWMWHWAEPTDRRVPWDRARVAFMDANVLVAKRAAIREYRSQVTGPRRSGRGAGAPLPATVLDRFRRPFEVVFT